MVVTVSVAEEAEMVMAYVASVCCVFRLVERVLRRTDIGASTLGFKDY